MYERFLQEDPKVDAPWGGRGLLQRHAGAYRRARPGSQVKVALTEEQQRAVESQQALVTEQDRTARTQKALLAERARAERERKKPLYKRGWFWGVVVSGVAVVGAGIGLGVGLAPRDRATDGGFVDLNFALHQAPLR